MRTLLVAVLLVFITSPAWASCPTGDTIDIRCTDTSARSYVVIGQVEGSDADLMKVKCRMRENASNMGADAVLNYDVTMGSSTTPSTAKGIAVRYAKPGETGTYYLSGK